MILLLYLKHYIKYFIVEVHSELNIGIEVTLVRGDRITGIERTIIELLKQFNKIEVDQKEVEFVFLAHKNFKKNIEQMEILKDKRIVYTPFNNRIINDQFWIPYISKKEKIDLMYFTTLGPSIFYNMPFMIHVHDAIPWLFESTLSKGMKLYYKPCLEIAFKKKKLKKVTTVSKHSKEDLKSLFKFKDEDINVVYNGVSNLDDISISANNNIGKNILNSKFIMSIATIEPRKNLQALINAFEKLATEDSEIKLVLVGRKGWNESVKVRNEFKERVVTTGFISDFELKSLLQKTQAFILPSYYEGFGLPVLEAMKYGAPCIISNNSSLPEVGGDAAIYFDPHNYNEIYKKIKIVLGDSILQNEMVKKGEERIKTFTWEITMKKILKSFDEVKEVLNK